MNSREMLDKIRASAHINDSEKQIAIKLNKAGKIKFQLLAIDSDHLFKTRVQHFIPKLPDNDDANEKIMVIDCQGANCPVCAAAQSFKNCGVTVEQVNDAYTPIYPYRNLRSVFTQPEHFLVGARIIADNADDGSYLPKDAPIGSTQLIQLSKSALTSLMSAYEDFLDDYDGDIDSLPPLFGILDDSKDNIVESFTISCRIQTQPWSYNFTFGKTVKTNLEDIDKTKLELLEKDVKVDDSYLEAVVARINKIQNYFTKPIAVNVPNNYIKEEKQQKEASDEKSKYDFSHVMDDDDDDFSLDAML